MAKRRIQSAKESEAQLRQELVKHFRDARKKLCKQWNEQIAAKGLLAGLTEQDVQTESSAIYDTCVSCLETGQFEAAQTNASRMAQRAVRRAMTPEQILSLMLTLRDVHGGSLSERYRADLPRLMSALGIYEPVANKILTMVALAFIEEREKVVRQQQEAIRELSTPVLQLHEGLIILPIIGVIDTHRARQLTEELLRAIRANRARVAVLDITGVPAVDSKVANHLLQTVEAARLMGARVIVTGLSSEIAQTVVAIGVDLSRITTLRDLQSGVDEADRLLGYKVIRVGEEPAKLNS